jgi:cell division protein FtsW (lipid II flippase)
VRSLALSWLELAGWFGLALVWLSQGRSLVLWWQLAAIWAGFAVLGLLTRHLGGAHSLLLPAALLVGLGWIFLYRLRLEWAAHQFSGFVVGLAAYCVGLMGNWAASRTKYVFGVLAAALLIGTLLFGVWVGGAKAWLALGPYRFQPVEFARVLLILFVVRYLVENKPLLRLGGGWAAAKYWGPLALFMGCILLLLAVQRDLGPALLLFTVYCILSGLVVPARKLLAAYSGLAFAGIGVGLLLFPHLRIRMTAWLHPWEHAEGAGYQILQGLFALNSGKVLGRGIGAGMGELIPEVHTDFLFALVGEELGFAGALSLLSLYLIMAFIGLRLADHTSDPIEKYTAVGIVLLWSVQVFMVVGGIIRLVPLTGMTLPFVSYGSSSLVAQMWMLGILASVGRVRAR